MTWELVIKLAEVLVGLGVILVTLGRWGGRLETRRPPSIASRPYEESKANGQPTFGEIVRRLEKVETELPRDYLRRELALTLAEESKRDRDQIRALITATQRRVDELAGT